MSAVRSKLFVLAVVISVTLLLPRPAVAHCDTVNGPVVKDAKLALKTGDITPVLKWVKAEDESQIRAAFARTLKVRALNPEAQELADNYFFETLVRIHRAGEGVAYTGLKPAGTEIEPGIAAADQALDTGSVDTLVKNVTAELAGGIRQRFAKVQEAGRQSSRSVEAGREYVAAYVDFIHYIERIHQAISASHAHNEVQAAEAASHQHE